MKENFSKKIERKLSKLAIPNLSLYLIICYAVGYVIQIINPQFLYSYLLLEPYMIIKGEVWRLFTWIIAPPSSSNILFILITLYFYYSLGTTLERLWGTYRYNLYLFSGMLFTVIGCFLLFGYYYFVEGVVVYNVGYFFTTYYINMSIFLAFAATFPNMQVLLMFVLPIKVKYLGMVYAGLLLLSCFQGGLVMWAVVGSSLFNFLIFFLLSGRRIRITPAQAKQRTVYRTQVRKQQTVTRHKCAICGRTEETNPELEFRFCSKCNGNYEYCQDHLFTHEHVK